MSALQQIGIALHNYHDVYHSFPPAYTVDAKGRPMHSWRVLLLPHMEYGDLYAKFRMDEPWDSPHNLAVAHSNRLPIFLCPSDREADPNDTSYVMPIGPGMISDGPTAHAIKDFKDGTPNTIVVVEMSRSGILWTEPRDWTVPEGPILLNSPKGISSRSEHPGVVNVLYGDGSVNTISEGIQSESLRAMLTIDGGEPVEEMREDW
ncbi:MAG: DUF1559 domain-containing protein [Pirellulales bacterium]|nr:DUF1559 domain-containing protein [Pirellulales bacterium]